MTTLREITIERIRLELDPSQEGIGRECFRLAKVAVEAMPIGTFSDEMRAASENDE